MNILKFFFSKKPLGINLRNYLILANNSSEAMKIANDKIATKELLNQYRIATAQTVMIIDSVSKLDLLSTLPQKFVIKPNRGFGGNGILVLRKSAESFVDLSGHSFSMAQIKKHARKIMDGQFSGAIHADKVLIEEMILPSKNISFSHSSGLSDVRVVCVKNEPVMAMMRYSTKKTKGKANLSAGAVGLAIDIKTGKISHVHAKKETVKITTQDLGIPADFVFPKWKEILSISIKASKASGLVISGIDVILDANDQVLVLEINGRPGIEIQNVNKKSLLNAMLKI